MKLIRTFQITSDEFYSYLEEHLLEEIKKTTKKKNIHPSVLRSGYSYENKDARSKVTINNYERGKIYQVTVSSYTQFVRVRYTTEQTDEGLKITFEQSTSEDKNLEKKNILYRTWHNWVTFGRMSHTLYDMRTDIFNIREGIQPKNTKQNPAAYSLLKKMISKKAQEEDQ